MRFSDLTKEQKIEVKQRLLTERMEAEGKSPSYGELVDVDATISDEECEEAFSGTEFVSDDFSCGVAADRDGVIDELAEWARHGLDYKGCTEYFRCGVAWAQQELLTHLREIRS